MNKLFILFLLLVMGNKAIAQTAAEVDTTTLIQGPPNSFTETHISFLKWKHHPDSFSFYLYNRWGEKLIETTNPYFMVDQELHKGVKLMDGVYVYRLSYIDSRGKKHKKTASITYIDTH